MRQLTIIALLLFCLNESNGQTTVLEKNVTLNVTNVTLDEALRSLQSQYHIHFSYANNLIPLQQKVSVSAKNQPLSVVLKQLFTGTPVSFQVVGTQVVLRNDGSKHSKPVQESKAPPQSSVSKIDPLDPVTASTESVVGTETHVVPVPVPTQHLSRQERRKLRLQAFSTQVQEKFQSVTQTLTEAVAKTSHLGGTETTATNIPKMPETGTDTGNTTDTLPPVTTQQVSDTQDSTTAPTDTSSLDVRLFQLTFVPPIGSNGREAGKYINHLSINVIAGHARGLYGAEFGGFANLAYENVYGVQFAGFMNTVGGHVKGGQFAGFSNLTRGSVEGVQFAGFMNATKESATNGGQFAGFMNISGGSVSFVQAAGFINLVRKNMTGVQLAGFMNTTKGDVNGIQAAGFMNVAHQVKGVQLGVINVADSVAGVQIGLLSFSRHGYRRLEVWGSEALYANAAFKMGTSYFHNVFAVGYRWTGIQSYLGFGYGIGSELPLGRRLSVNLDAVAWQIGSDKNWFRQLNMLNQFRANVSFRLGKRAAIFAGPSYNVYVTDVNDTDIQKASLPVPSWIWYDKISGHTRVAMWVGMNAGIRF